MGPNRFTPGNTLYEKIDIDKLPDNSWKKRMLVDKRLMKAQQDDDLFTDDGKLRTELPLDWQTYEYLEELRRPLPLLTRYEDLDKLEEREKLRQKFLPYFQKHPRKRYSNNQYDDELFREILNGIKHNNKREAEKPSKTQDYLHKRRLLYEMLDDLVMGKTKTPKKSEE